MKKLLQFSLLAWLMVSLGWPVFAAWNPPGPIKILIAFRAGGGSDTQVRLLAEALEATKGWKIIPQNVGGKGGANMANALKEATADGLTLGMAVTETFAYIPLADENAGYRPTDFTYITTTAPTQMGTVKLTSWFNDDQTGEIDIIEEYDHYKGEIQFDSTIYPFRSVALIHTDTNDVERHCTAFLVGPRELITAAHCIIHREKKTFLKNLKVSLNSFTKRETEREIGKIYPATPLFGGWNDKQKKFNNKDDWFLIKVEEPLGESLGWIGLKDSRGRTLPPKGWIDGARWKELEPKWRTTSVDILSNLNKIGDPWLLPNPQLPLQGYEDHRENHLKNYHKTMTILPAFMFPTRLDLRDEKGELWIYHPMSISYDCHIRGWGFDGLLVHDCNSSYGASGAPFLEVNGNEVYAISLNTQGKMDFWIRSSYKRSRYIHDSLEKLAELIGENKRDSDHYQLLVERVEKYSQFKLKRPLTPQYLQEKTDEYVEYMKGDLAFSGTFNFELDTEPRGSGLRSHYNLSVPTDTFFDRVSQYLRSQYPDQFQ